MKACRPIPVMTPEDEDRFMAKVQPEPNTGCWLWDGGVSNDGYGQFRLQGRQIRAHRVSFRRWSGDPGDLFVLHRCDTPCRPECPRRGARGSRSNMEDKAAKGRQHRPRGAKNAEAKLASEDVRAIRKRLTKGHKQADIAADFGVTHSNISAIARGKSWAWLGEAS